MKLKPTILPKSAKTSVTTRARSATRLVVPASVPPPKPKAPKIAPTTALTMPLRIRLAPRAASQPKITLVQLVPRSGCRPLSSRTSPTRRGAESSLATRRRYSPRRPGSSSLSYLSLKKSFQSNG